MAIRRFIGACSSARDFGRRVGFNHDVFYRAFPTPSRFLRRHPVKATSPTPSNTTDAGSGIAVVSGSSLPIWLLLNWVNQRLPSGPVVMPTGTLATPGTVNSVRVPPVVIRPI